MAQCPNCKKNLSCGCQRRNASDGTAVCSSCIVAYENNIKSTPSKTPQRFVPPPRQESTDPTNISVSYKPPTSLR
jgi:hypothetical protein